MKAVLSPTCNSQLQLDLEIEAEAPRWAQFRYIDPPPNLQLHERQQMIILFKSLHLGDSYIVLCCNNYSYRYVSYHNRKKGYYQNLSSRSFSLLTGHSSTRRLLFLHNCLDALCFPFCISVNSILGVWFITWKTPLQGVYPVYLCQA